MSGRWLASYRCLACGHEWSQPARWDAECQRCGSLYLKWVNYDVLSGVGGTKASTASE